jgi:hypothetical protein
MVLFLNMGKPFFALSQLFARRTGVLAFARAVPPFFPSAFAAGSFPSSGGEGLSFLACCNGHDSDGVADDVGGALLALRASGRYGASTT